MISKKTFLLLLIMIFCQTSIVLSKSNDKMQIDISKGVYIPSDIVNVNKLRTLPIPYSGKDYAFFQSIGKVSNIVISDFSSVEKKITLISDSNGDGIVDVAGHWYFGRKRFKEELKPAKFCSKEKFKRMKQDIIDGKSGSLFPNAEGVPFLERLMKSHGSVIRNKNGFMVTEFDADNQSMKRAIFIFSDNGINGVDLVFNVKYKNRGRKRISSAINYSVYCKNSFDPLVKDTVKKLYKSVKN